MAMGRTANCLEIGSLGIFYPFLFLSVFSYLFFS